MKASDSEGLGLSVTIFMGATLGVLALLAVPVWLTVRPQVFENPVFAQNDPLLNGPIVGYRPEASVPLAALRHDPIVDPKMVAALNAKFAGKSAGKSEKSDPAHRTAVRTARHSGGTPVAELQLERPQRSGFFLFNLFGG